MIYIILSICCSVTVAVLLKLARRYQINVLQAIMWNYLGAIILSAIFFRPEVAALPSPPSYLLLVLGTLLPVLFLILSASVRQVGIVKTEIAQRLSLFMPILAAVFLFHENFGTFRILGIAIGFIAIILTLLRRSADTGNTYTFPALVFLGFGIIDILFKQVAIDKSIPYTTALFVVFCIAFVVAMLILTYQFLILKAKLQLINLVCGLVLGCFNFGNILFYMKAHRSMAENPSTVFAAMNMGVIVTGSLIGVFVFKEKVSTANYVGIILALIAILFITLSQANAI